MSAQILLHRPRPAVHVQKLTDRIVAQLKPRPHRFAVRDESTGLELRVLPNGAKLWTLRFRSLRKQRRWKIGAYPVVSLAKARKIARQLQLQISTGTDPRVEEQQAIERARQAEQQAERDANRLTFGASAERYIEEYARLHKRTWKADRRYLMNECAAWSERPLDEITRQEVRALLDAMCKRGPVLRDRALEVIRKLFNWALDSDLVQSNPAARLGKATPKEKRKRSRLLTDDELRGVWAKTEQLPAAMQAFWQLRLLTAQRGGEVRDMHWQEVDIDAALWTIPGERSKNGRSHIVPLSTAAVDILKELPRGPESGYVLAGARGKRQQGKAAATFGWGDGRGHDMRRTAATLMRKAGVSRADVGAVLNHIPAGAAATSHYDYYDQLTEKVRALDTWARVLDGIVKPQSE